ncbi:MAG: hypothetical protein ACPL1B_10165, partial [Thermoprotei archaeon]
MAYNRFPFSYYGKEKRQYRLDVDKANDNFTVLANAFKDNNPDTGIVKQADTLDDFHASQTPQPNTIPTSDSNGKVSNDWLYASQTPQPNTIPVSYNSGKLDNDWFIVDTIYDNVSKIIDKNIDITPNNDYTSTVDISIKSGETVAVNFKATRMININMPMDDYMTLDIKLYAHPTITYPTFSYDMPPAPPIPLSSDIDYYIVLYPNGFNPTPYCIRRVNESHNIDAAYLTLARNTVFPNKLFYNRLNIVVKKTPDVNFIDTWGPHYDCYVITLNNNVIPYTYQACPPFGEIQMPQVGNVINKMFWYSYTCNGAYVPWTTFGTIRSAYRMDG